jgi:catechol 2,3-dioxygenase-like lactoylglutathione lyase family enzyme
VPGQCEPAQVVDREVRLGALSGQFTATADDARAMYQVVQRGPADGEIMLTVGGGPTEDKPTVTFASPTDPDRVTSELVIRVPDCLASYQVLRSRGAEFLTPPVDWGYEVWAFFRDPDGHLLEISQSGQQKG